MPKNIILYRKVCILYTKRDSTDPLMQQFLRKLYVYIDKSECHAVRGALAIEEGTIFLHYSRQNARNMQEQGNPVKELLYELVEYCPANF